MWHRNVNKTKASSLHFERVAFRCANSYVSRVSDSFADLFVQLADVLCEKFLFSPNGLISYFALIAVATNTSLPWCCSCMAVDTEHAEV